MLTKLHALSGKCEALQMSARKVYYCSTRPHSSSRVRTVHIPLPTSSMGGVFGGSGFSAPHSTRGETIDTAKRPTQLIL